MERFIVGVDGSTGGDHALRWAVGEAAVRGAGVTAVLVWDYLDQVHPDGSRRFDAHYGEEDARRTLDVLVERALGPDADVERHVVCDRPAPGLLDASKDADLLVVGARGLGGFRGLVMGSVSQRCLEHAECPVAVVHQPDHDEPARHRIVVGVDGSEASAAALAWAVDEARRREATLEVVHAWELPYAADLGYVGGAFDAVARSATELVDGMLASAGVRPVDVIRTVVHETPVYAITEAAAGADLVVVGTRGRGGFTGLLLGSVSHQVARHAGRPVVVVPQAGGGR